MRVKKAQSKTHRIEKELRATVESIGKNITPEPNASSSQNLKPPI